MKPSDDDSLTDGLRTLPPPQQDPARVARTQAYARGVFRQAAAPAGAGAILARLYFRAEPALVASIVVVYLGWAIDTVAGLFR